MSDLSAQLERLGLERYLDSFVGEGFDTWDTLTDIQESDFDALNVRLGHRRKLQRAIADYKGIPFERLLGQALQEGQSESGRTLEDTNARTVETERPPGQPLETKRKYKRHPKPDEYAPDRPPSAYVIFSSKVRVDVKDQNLTFTQIAKLVGDRWQKLDPAGKEPFEAEANIAKERYSNELAAYRKTDNYKAYTTYLAGFKAKQGQAAEAKRPKLEAESSGSVISIKSYDASLEQSAPSLGHLRGGSVASSASSPFIGGSMQPSGSSGSISTRPQLASSRSGTPPSAVQLSREYVRMGGASGHSSMSFDPMGRTELPETMRLTAGLSIGTGTATPPMSTLQFGVSPSDSAGSTDPLARSRLSYFMQQQQSQQMPSALGLQSPTGYSSPSSSTHQSTLPSPSTSEPARRDRVGVHHGYEDIPRGFDGVLQPPPLLRGQLSTPAQLPPLLSREQARDFLPGGQSARTLPPPRSSTVGPPGLPHLGRALDPPRPLTAEALQLRHAHHDTGRPSRNRPESDAANALAGLAGFASGVARSATGPAPDQPPAPGSSRQ